jgi:ferredoxin
MDITRKEFFRQTLLSFGRAALNLAETAQGSPPAVRAASPETISAVPGPDMVAQPDNGRCLAGNCGCFACIERCEPRAIALVLGEGIRVDPEICSGCGTCEYVCPVFPKAVVLTARQQAISRTEPAS